MEEERNELMMAIMSIIGVVVMMMVTIIYMPVTYGIVLIYFWEWFMLPVFDGLPIITYPQAMGVMMFLTLFKSGKITGLKKKYVSNGKIQTNMYLRPFLILFIGWLVKTLFL